MTSEIRDDNFTEDDFNRYRITKCEIEAVLQALKELFITLWNKSYPNEPWTNDAASVEQFEVNVKNACQIRAASYSDPKKEKQKIKRILAGLQNDDSWYRCDWDISILSKVLVDCRLFDLEGISVELCDHIKGIGYIRNKMAHPTAFGVEEQVFKDTMKSLKKHLEGLRCVISVDHHIHTLEQLESQDKPTSGRQLKDMCHEIELMKRDCKFYQLERKYNELEVLLDKKDTDIQHLKKTNADLEKALNEKKTEFKQLLDGVNNTYKCIKKRSNYQLILIGLILLLTALLNPRTQAFTKQLVGLADFILDENMT